MTTSSTYSQSSKVYIGIDGGLGGALVALQEGKIISKVVMPVVDSSTSRREYDAQALISYLEGFDIENTVVILEKAHPMPKLGSVQAFNFGKGYGTLIGILSAMKMPYQIIHARRWQKEMFQDINYSDTKQASAIIASRLFPSEDFRKSEKSKNVHDGLTDAALIAYYGFRKNI
jgi:hypothetical protein